jgi:hypothetical protein
MPTRDRGRTSSTSSCGEDTLDPLDTLDTLDTLDDDGGGTVRGQTVGRGSDIEPEFESVSASVGCALNQVRRRIHRCKDTWACS